MKISYSWIWTSFEFRSNVAIEWGVLSYRKRAQYGLISPPLLLCQTAARRHRYCVFFFRNSFSNHLTFVIKTFQYHMDPRMRIGELETNIIMWTRVCTQVTSMLSIWFFPLLQNHSSQHSVLLYEFARVLKYGV
ncbi:hypothetical protein RchiOBHm_Chr5g0056451 [Rosa chinensis]|uniref:Uncharacterized protein n=1 Tax=Rosa chinensis TaxID=74649 RepID=A0A2P6QGN3_ROSCH|nr:hypothetical protein RchiOBHm_Chr5g0056451 [Rosa chinensis]